MTNNPNIIKPQSGDDKPRLCEICAQPVLLTERHTQCDGRFWHPFCRNAQEAIDEYRTKWQALRDRFDEEYQNSLTKPITWQPIETAPKDGTSVLVYEGGHQAVVFWLGGSAGWSDGEHVKLSPTHWMPLPPEPENGE